MSVASLTSPADRTLSSSKLALASLQRSDGSWEGEVVWCPIITAQVVITRAVLGRPGDDAWKSGVRRYFTATQNRDGGWGLHPLSTSYLFVTTLVYVAARLLGESPNAALMARARDWIHRHPEGLSALPSWGKLWLAFIGLYPYAGINPIPPEFFLLPKWFPINADRLQPHTRYICLGLAYLYGQRFAVSLGDLGEALKRELYATPLSGIATIRDWHKIAQSDLHDAPGACTRLVYDLLRYAGMAARKWKVGRPLRERALQHSLEMARNEIASTHGRCLSPVSGVLHVLDLYANNPDDPLIDVALEGLESWRWEDKYSGIRYMGARSQLWDTAFALRALLARRDESFENSSPVQKAIKRGYAYLSSNQCQATPACQNRDRQGIFGGWCFGNSQHGWPVSDCTGEAISALLACHEVTGLIPEAERIPAQRLIDAISFMLTRQNTDGGFGAFERNLAAKWLKHVNVSEIFGRCMTDRSYIECTASCVEALVALRQYLSLHIEMERRVERAIAKGVAFLRNTQQKDGSYPGFWGINFIYATGFALRALSSAGLTKTDATVRRALAWLQAKQRHDGGWGEHYSGCLDHRYAENDESLISSTNWALLGLMEFHTAELPAIQRGLTWLKERRNLCGLWPRESVNGQFFDSAMLEYTYYNSIFGAWALAKGGAGNETHEAHVRMAVSGDTTNGRRRS